jgi:hypothetical protein
MSTAAKQSFGDILDRNLANQGNEYFASDHVVFTLTSSTD